MKIMSSYDYWKIVLFGMVVMEAVEVIVDVEYRRHNTEVEHRI